MIMADWHLAVVHSKGQDQNQQAIMIYSTRFQLHAMVR